MEVLSNEPIENPGNRGRGKYAVMLFVLFWLGGCGIWNGYLHPDYTSSRADQLCHPYGQCSQGSWVAGEGAAEDVTVARTQCREAGDLPDGNGWWADSVTRGLEFGQCMEKKGFTLQQ